MSDQIVIQAQGPVVIINNHGLDEKDVPHEYPGIWNPAVVVYKKMEEAGSIYQGPIGPSGRPNGFGSLRYRDGSVYEGHFIEGLKHGQGKMTYRDGTVYEGFWENELQHGQGQLIHGDGSKITTTFCFGRKHGKGTLIDTDGKSHNVMYYHDMENLLDLSTSGCWDRAWLNIFFSVIAVGSIFPAVQFDLRIFGVTIVMYLGLLIETACSSTRGFLSNIMTPNDLQIYIQNLSNMAPHIKFWIQNYHYETRHYTDSKGNRKTKKVRVNTHFACEYYRWGDCVDRSPEIDSIEIIKKFRLTRLLNGIKISYSPDAWASFSEQEGVFKKINIQDVHWDYNVLNELPSYKDEILLHNAVDKPWYANSKWYWAFTIFFMGWLYRILFILNSAKITFNFSKIILK